MRNTLVLSALVLLLSLPGAVMAEEAATESVEEVEMRGIVEEDILPILVEQGVELLFGRWNQATTTPGLHYWFPTPIGRTITQKNTWRRSALITRTESTCSGKRAAPYRSGYRGDREYRRDREAAIRNP